VGLAREAYQAGRLPADFSVSKAPDNGDSLPESRIPHNCGVYTEYYKNGLSPQSTSSLETGFGKLENRGQDGRKIIALTSDGSIFEWGSSHQMRDSLRTAGYSIFFDQIIANEAKMVLAHHRYTTSGDPHAFQPFVSAKEQDEEVELPALVTMHNGNLINGGALRDLLPPHIREGILSDTHALHEYLRRFSGRTIEEKITNGALENVDLSYSLVLADPEAKEMFAFRDPWGNRPLAIGEKADGTGWIVASEEYALEGIARNIRSLRAGEGVKISDSGVESFYQDPRSPEPAYCVMEPIYFANADSRIETFHRVSGAELARSVLRKELSQKSLFRF